MDEKIDQPNDRSQNQSRVSVTNAERKTQIVLRINADDFSTKHLVIFWALYLAIIIAVSLLTMALPPTFIGINNRQSLFTSSLHNCSNPVGFNSENLVYCNPISNTNPTSGLLLTKMSPKNQFLLVYINFIIEDTAKPKLQFNQTIQLQEYQIEPKESPKGAQFKKFNKIQSQSALFSFNSFESQRIYESNGYSFKGYRAFFGYQKYIEHENSLIHFTFKTWPIPNLKDVYMDVVTITPQFTVFAIVIRYIFFALSLGTTIGYYIRYRLIPDNMKTLEQKMIFYLSIFTVMFNDPLYAATIMAPNGFTAFVSVAFVVNFITFLVGFWMVFIDRILYISGQKFQNVINKKKIAYVVLLYIFLFILQFQLALFRLDDAPIIPGYQTKKGSIVTFEVISFIIFACGLAYISVQFVRSTMNFFQKIWRNQMFLAFSFLYIIVMIVMLVINGFSVYEYAGNRILILFSFMNMYTIYLQYMYSINSKEAQHLDKQRLFGHDNQRNQIQTIVSNFGNDQIMVDLDSEPQTYTRVNHSTNQYRKNNQQNQQQKVQKMQENQNEFQEQTLDNFNQPQKQENKQFETFQLED